MTLHAPEQAEATRLEPGSFRDRDSRVFYTPDGVFRGLSEQGAAEFEGLAATRFFARFLQAGSIVATERVEAGELPDPALAEAWAAVLRHHTIPFISYAYEWPFGMLQDAALLQLELLAAALQEDFVLKDATPYNVQWEGAQPVFIDIPSFVRLEPGSPWPGYRQFCELNLYPLMLQAYKNVPFRPWLRGSIDGIQAQECRGLMSWRDRLRPGVLLHVVLQAAMQNRHADTRADVRTDLKKAGFHKELIQANVKRLTKLVRGMRWKPARSEWSDYAGDNTYDEQNRKLKERFVRDAAQARPRRLVWDLGCNTGDYSRVVSEAADTVVAMDADHLAVERLYQRLKDEGQRGILPLVVNVADSSPGLGWRGAERKPLAARGKPDLVLCLALIHHVVIGANIPLREFITWLADLGSDLVIEFVTRDDPMVKTLLRNKEDKYSDYRQEVLEACLRERFSVARQEALQGGQRVLYFATRKG